MRAFFAVLWTVLVTVVLGQSVSEVTVTALPAPSAPSGAEPPPFSISVVTAPIPDTPTAPLSSTVFVSANPPPLPSSAISPIAPVPSPAMPSSMSMSGPAPSLSQPVPSVPVPSPSGGGGGSVPGAGICGLGYTYCGYILRDHQGYPEQDVVQAYCAGSPDNCAGGTPKTDPIQALYICVPPTSSKPRGLLRGRQAPQPSQASSGGGQNPTGCANPQAGNKLLLLCSCGGSCLNPEADHIGRCDKPCS